MSAKAIMIQGTGTNTGKSMIVAGLARAFSRRGLTVRPFKPQNMSNNAAVTTDGGEIGRAQALQAKACGVDPHTDMNPVLLKPQTNMAAQLVVQGQVVGTQHARDFGKNRAALMPQVLQSFERLRTVADLVIVEGAGSPAETNLRARDIANMGFARAADVPVILIGDIDRGGVIAQIVGTQAVLETPDQDMIKAFVVNKFRGDPSLFDEGRSDTEARTGWPCLGVVPWFDAASKLPAEDVMDLPARARSGGTGLKIAVPHLPRIANFDDLDPLSNEPEIDLSIIPSGQPIPADTDVILLVGSKATISDLEALRAEGWDIDIAAHLRRGGHILGLCGGYQMLGKTIADPDGIEGPAGSATGLGHLDVHTTLVPAKQLTLNTGHHVASGTRLSGYEIHMGQTTGPDCDRGWLELGSGPQGATSMDGRVQGCYLHGLFTSDAFRAAWMDQLGHTSTQTFDAEIEETLDALAQHLENNLNLDLILKFAR